MEAGATGEGEGEGEGEPGSDITSNVYPPYIDEGTLVILTAPAGGTGHQWKKDGVNINGAVNETLVFDPVTEEDAGSYTVAYDNGLKAVVTSAPFILTVSAEGSVPAAGLLGLALLAGACGLGGVRLVRRRK